MISSPAAAWLARKQPEKISELRQLAVVGSQRDVCLFAAKDIAPERQQRLQKRLSSSAVQEHIATLQTLYFGDPVSAR